MRQWISSIVSAYGIFVWLGGMVGFALSQSYLILFLGSLAGSVLVVSGFTMLKGSPIGYWGALFVATALMVYFAYRIYESHLLMPFGAFAILSILLLLLLILMNFLNKN